MYWINPLSWYIKSSTTKLCIHIDGLVQERHNSSALAMELHLSCTNPSILNQALPVIKIPTQSLFLGKVLNFVHGSLALGKVFNFYISYQKEKQVDKLISDVMHFISFSSFYQNSCFANFSPKHTNNVPFREMGFPENLWLTSYCIYVIQFKYMGQCKKDALELCLSCTNPLICIVKFSIKVFITLKSP